MIVLTCFYKKKLLLAPSQAMRSDTALPRKRFSQNVLRSDLRRPWGRKKEHVFCYAITLEALLKDTFPNKCARALQRRTAMRRPERRHLMFFFCISLGLVLRVSLFFFCRFVRKFRHSMFKLAVNKLPITVMISSTSRAARCCASCFSMRGVSPCDDT